MNSNRLKIFVSAYACEPNQGSEIGVGWHWVLEMSKYFDLWVLTRKNNQENIENWLKDNPIENPPHFIYFDLPKKLRFWKRGMRGVRTYYVLWQSLTNRIVKQTMESNNIDIYHLLTYGNALWPVSSYGKSKFFIWGPTSVGTVVSEEFSKHYGLKNKIKEALQRLMASTLPYNIGFKSRCKSANLILCKTERTRECIPEKYRDKGVVFTDVAVEPLNITEVALNESKLVKYLAVGRLDSWRGFDLLIEAFALAVKENQQLHLDILGKGGDKERLQSLIEKLDVSKHITLQGQVTMDEYYAYMASCDVIVNPTLKEGAVTTAFDSMSFSKPLICINTGGYTRYFDNDYAVVLDISTRPKLIEELSASILRLTNKELRKEMSKKIEHIRSNFTWEERGKEIRDVIQRTIPNK